MDVATLIGVGVDKLRKWEERDKDPVDTGDIESVEKYFGVSLAKLKDIKTFDFVPNPVDRDYKDKYIASLERENKMIQKDLDLSLGELRHNILLTRAIAETNQEVLVELLAKGSKKSWEELADSVGIKNGEKYQRMKEEGNFPYAGK